ncbi:MAG: MmoB/DmpM family protein [Pseudonocardia sp.]
MSEVAGRGRTKARLVGVDLQDSEDNHAIVEAIQADNPDVTVTRMPGLVKLRTPGELVIRQASVADRLGRDWETHEFQISIVSYSGNISDWDDEKIVIKWEH